MGTAIERLKRKLSDSEPFGQKGLVNASHIHIYHTSLIVQGLRIRKYLSVQAIAIAGIIRQPANSGRLRHESLRMVRLLLLYYYITYICYVVCLIHPNCTSVKR